jgi:hypothetical protein
VVATSTPSPTATPTPTPTPDGNPHAHAHADPHAHGDGDARHTTIKIVYDVGMGNTMYVRGSLAPCPGPQASP